MAAGRPCVASDIGGLSEIITDGIDGLLVPACDPGALAKAVKRLLEDPVLRERIASAGRERALKDFNIEKCVSGTVEVYEKAVSEAYLRQRSRRKG
jgi:glycosyltransferase involved in cell wall biosynthesis